MHHPHTASQPVHRHLAKLRFSEALGGQSVPELGSMVSFLAVPLVAVITLDASPGQMGVLAAARSLPHLLVGLFAGVYVDRLRRRPILIWTDIGRGLLLATIPLAFALGLLWPLLSDVRTLHGRLETILEYSSE